MALSHDCHIFGTINGHEFDMTGGGKGDGEKGVLETTVRSTKGALPFSPLLVGPSLGYGYYQYLPFPDGKSPFQAAMQSGGYVKQRIYKFEDGGVLHANFKYTYQGDKIKGEIQLTGSGFPANGPVMTNSLTALDRTVAKMMWIDDKNLRDLNHWSFSTSTGEKLHASVQTNYSFASPLPANLKEKMPVFLCHKLEFKASKTDITMSEAVKAVYTFL